MGGGLSTTAELELRTIQAVPSLFVRLGAAAQNSTLLIGLAILDKPAIG